MVASILDLHLAAIGGQRHDCGSDLPRDSLVPNETMLI